MAAETMTVKEDGIERIDPRDVLAQEESEFHVIAKDLDTINVADLKARGEGEMHIIREDYVFRKNPFISGPWKSDEEFEAWRETQAQASAMRAAEFDARKRNTIFGRLKSAFSRSF